MLFNGYQKPLKRANEICERYFVVERIFAFMLLAAVCAISLAACGSTDEVLVYSRSGNELTADISFHYSKDRTKCKVLTEADEYPDTYGIAFHIKTGESYIDVTEEAYNKYDKSATKMDAYMQDMINRKVNKSTLAKTTMDNREAIIQTFSAYSCYVLVDVSDIKDDAY